MLEELCGPFVPEQYGLGDGEVSMFDRVSGWNQLEWLWSGVGTSAATLYMSRRHSPRGVQTETARLIPRFPVWRVDRFWRLALSRSCWVAFEALRLRLIATMLERMEGH